MQPNTIAFTYDHDNDGGTTAAISSTVTRHSEELNKSTYRTSSHTEASPDTLNFYRTAAKRSGEFMGSQKVSVKRTKTMVVDTASGLETKAPMINELSFSIPIGVTNAEKLSFLMEHIGFLSSSEGKAALIQLLNVSEI
jgi:hypothetical protein